MANLLILGSFVKITLFLPAFSILLLIKKLKRYLKSKARLEELLIYASILFLAINLVQTFTYSLGADKLSKEALKAYGISCQAKLNITLFIASSLLLFSLSFFKYTKKINFYVRYYLILTLVIYLASVLVITHYSDFFTAILLSLLPTCYVIMSWTSMIVYKLFDRFRISLSKLLLLSSVLLFLNSIRAIWTMVLLSLSSSTFLYLRVVSYVLILLVGVLQLFVFISFIYRVERKLKIISKYSERSIEQVIKLILIELSNIIGTGSEAIVRLAKEKFVKREKKAVVLKEYIPVNLDKIEEIKFLAYLIESIETVVGTDASLAILRNVYAKNKYSKSIIMRANKYIRTPNSVEQFLRELKSKK